MENMDFGSLLNMAKQFSTGMGDKVKGIKEEMAQITTTGIAGGGAVTVVMNGQYKIQKLEIKDELINKEEKPLLQEIIIAAVNNATESIKSKIGEKVKGLTQGLNLPLDGLF